ncbi:MAG: polysaccharide biosynthesis/export family protein [Gemmatimonadota bacterium]
MARFSFVSPFALVAGLWLLMLAPATTPAPLEGQVVAETGVATLPAVQEGFGLRPGDQVTVTFFTSAGERLEVVGGERIVDRNGNIYLPFVGNLRVQGLDVAGLRELVTRRFADLYENPVVDAQVRIRVNITGAVRQAGSYLLDPTSTLVDALAQAGGAGAEIDLGVVGGASDPSQIRLVRDGRAQILNFAPDQASPEVLGMLAQSGDWLHVPPRGRSRTRENITFVSSILGLITSAAAVVVLATR